MDIIRYRTKKPVSLYLWILTVILFTINAVVDSDNLWGPFVYIVIYTVIVYWYFASYSGQLILTTNKIIVKYAITTFLNFEIPLESVIEYDYKKGFYDMTADKSYGVNNFVPRISYDTLILKCKTEESKINRQEIKINTRMYQFDKFLIELRKTKEIKETVT